MRLFPKLESIWSRIHRSSDKTWAQRRRACSPHHFETYFRLAPRDSVTSKIELDALLAKAGDPSHIAEMFLAAVGSPRRHGGTRAATLLEALLVEADRIPIDVVELLLSGIFQVADRLDVEADKDKAFDIGDNFLRIHWLLRALLLHRADLKTRSTTLLRSSRAASLAWRVDLANSARKDYRPSADQEVSNSREKLVDSETADPMVKGALKAIGQARRAGSLLAHPQLAPMLYRWRDLAQDDGRAVKRWLAARLKEDASVVRLAEAFTSTSWSHRMSISGPGDLVATRSDRAGVEGLDTILDRGTFRSRLEKLAKRLDPTSCDMGAVKRFLDARAFQDKHPD